MVATMCLDIENVIKENTKFVHSSAARWTVLNVLATVVSILLIT